MAEVIKITVVNDKSITRTTLCKSQCWREGMKFEEEKGEPALVGHLAWAERAGNYRANFPAFT